MLTVNVLVIAPANKVSAYPNVKATANVFQIVVLHMAGAFPGVINQQKPFCSWCSLLVFYRARGKIKFYYQYNN